MFKLEHSWSMNYVAAAGLCKFILKVYWQWKKWATGCWRQGCTCKIASQARPSGKRNYIWIRRFCKINCRPIQIFHWRWPKVDPKLILAANWVQIASWCHPGKCSATICMLSHSVTNTVTVTASKFFFTFLNTCQQLPSIICQFVIFIVKTSSQASKLR